MRIEIARGRYHITARGNERRDIFRDERDRQHFVELLTALPERFGVRLHAYVLMPNHYHLLLETPEANLSLTVQWLGTAEFAQRLQKGLRANLREQRGVGKLGAGPGWEQIVRAVEAKRRERWEGFVNRYGDWGRDAALWLGRRLGRLSLGQLAGLAGGMDYAAVGAAVSRFPRRLKEDKSLAKTLRRIEDDLSNI